MTIRNGLTSLALLLHLYLMTRQRHHGPREAANANTGSLLAAREGADAANVTITCVPFGECEACPDDAPFGNRRLMHCSPVSQSTTNTSSNHTTTDSAPVRSGSPRLNNGKSATQGETPAWQSCGRIPSVERADFYEFFACNLFLALAAVLTVLVRTKLVQTRQARNVAARIWGRR
ncbi:hypothetical protein CONPUDRAFT_146145 [Coniophora puteana RWD-64-598 SS2]|uniref:CDR ABC transporter domain-containing protein n=1 Tax=Coniophora puteana (strain RWD-64-598) TaxID=741705 RepID=A0A5M3MEM4_CONPW|nr:uncharacterized protein CONPUDRAFT_146145 [Coniophora puteana RWD-64-598 SS2]EIW77031.1 hypothetical protein CONPUDRAFT_146145 [Coniophora puteana RWD-64-598 SS2]